MSATVTEIKETRTTIKPRLAHVKTKISLMVLMVVGMVASASADMCWTSITDILDGIANNMLPSFLGLVTAAVPLLIVLAVVGFVMKFLDRILEMLSIR